MAAHLKRERGRGRESYYIMQPKQSALLRMNLSAMALDFIVIPLSCSSSRLSR
jgi:hypothetical protein